MDGGLTIKSENTSRGKRSGRFIKSVVLDLSSLRCLSMTQVKMLLLEGNKQGDVMENYGGEIEGNCLFFFPTL